MIFLVDACQNHLLHVHRTAPDDKHVTSANCCTWHTNKTQVAPYRHTNMWQSTPIYKMSQVHPDRQTCYRCTVLHPTVKYKTSCTDIQACDKLHRFTKMSKVHPNKTNMLQVHRTAPDRQIWDKLQRTDIQACDKLPRFTKMAEVHPDRQTSAP